MSRFRNTIVSCVLVGEASLSSALENKHGNQVAIAQMMSQMSALRKDSHAADRSEMLNKFGALTQITPGAQESMTKALNSVIADIDQNVVAKISAGHAETQAELDKRISDLELSTSGASVKKTDADSTDKQWFDCVAEEKNKRVAVEAADATLTQAQADVIKPCQDQDASASWSSNPSEASFSCDFSVNGNCDQQLLNFKTQMKHLIEETKSDLELKRSSYRDFKTQCDAKKAAEATAKQAHLDSISAWSAQKVKCTSAHEARNVAICLFGSSLQQKCAGIDAYNSLIKQIDETGSVYSHQDRMHEWETAAMTKCMLKGVAAGSKLDQSALTACEQSLNFDNDVGVLDKYAGRFGATTSPDQYQYSCLEDSVSFLGKTWNIKESDEPQSSDYVEEAFAPIFKNNDEFPFALCSSDQAPPEPASPEPAFASRPEKRGKGKCATYEDTIPGPALGTTSHTVVMALKYDENALDATQRQWILNIGQTTTGAEHWLWNAHQSAHKIQFGKWNGAQIGVAGIHHARTLATTYESSTGTYSLYLDGTLAATRKTDLNIKNGRLMVGVEPYQIGFRGCIYGVDIFRSALSPEQVASAARNILPEE